jgi:chromosome partitioning protein
MLRTASHTRPHIVVLGNHKGGSGKSTLAMHIAAGLMKEGRRVATLDLDFQQRTFTHYIENRRAWAKDNGITLNVPTHLCVDDAAADKSSLTDHARISLISDAISALELHYDFIVIDTPGGASLVSVFAHGLADTLITPVNDSFVDLDAVLSLKKTQDQLPRQSEYSEAVRRALDARRAVTKRKIDWFVVRNRVSSLSSRNGRDVHKAIEATARKAGFQVATGLSERVVYRQFFPIGLTAFDSLETSLLGLKPTMAHVLARQEVRQLIASVRLLSTYGEAEPWSINRQTHERPAALHAAVG